MKETAKHHNAFYEWYALDRNFDKTWTKVGVSKNSLAIWIKVFNWHNRADALDRTANRKAANSATNQKLKRQTEMLKKHFDYGTNLISVGASYLQQKGVDNGGQAIQAVKIGIETQRKAEGLPDWLVDIAEMNDEQLLKERDRLFDELQHEAETTSSD